MDTRRLFALVAVLAATTSGGSSLAGESGRDPIDGVYKMVSRKFADGRELRPPEIIGRGVRLNGLHLVVIQERTPGGEYVTFAAIDEYELTPTEYRVRSALNTLYLPHEKKQLVASEGLKGSAPVVRADGRVEFTPPHQPDTPLKPPRLVYDQRGVRAFIGDAFVDTWEKVQ
jgi:hypothetical protein